MYNIMGEMKINGRSFYFDHLANLKRVSKSTWTVERRGVEYRIEGGRHAGGSSREWFVEGGYFNGPIFCTSLVDALRLLEGM